MTYKEYIDLGFKRTDLDCSVEFNQTGYSGFALEKKINKKILISVESGNLDKPKLYIKKRNSETYHIMPISTDAVCDLILQDTRNDFYPNLVA
jgi:hypothetical protein